MGEVATIHHVAPDGTAFSFLPAFFSHEGEYSAKVCAGREVSYPLLLGGCPTRLIFSRLM